MKVLVIRFSSFGDVTQCLSVPSKILELDSKAEIHWAVREDLSELLNGHPAIHKIWRLSRKTGLKGLLQLALQLREQNFSHIYDAHNNLRSHFICWILRLGILGSTKPQLVRKSQKRWKRFLLFKLRKNTYQMPFSGQRDLLEPLKAWGLNDYKPATPQLFVDDIKLQMAKNKLSPFLNGQADYIALAPSAAFELKRWPLEYWKQLIQLQPLMKFVVLGGPEDLFLNELVTDFPRQVLNLAGQCTLMESAAVVRLSKALVSNDTGLLHVAEQLGHPAVALMGPAPFGFPSRDKTKILQLDLVCKPCSKHGQGPCVNSEFHLCLRGIKPETVLKALHDVQEMP